MAINFEQIYIGYDLNDEYSQISYWMEGMNEPLSLSTITNQERFMIPTVVCKKKGIRQWFYGEEAVKCHKANEGTLVDKLVTRSINDEIIEIDGEKYSAFSLLELFVKKTINLISSFVSVSHISRLTFACESLKSENVELLYKLSDSLPVNSEYIKFRDYKECFYYYAINQKKELTNHSVVLFDYRKDMIAPYFLSINNKSVPKVGHVEACQSYQMKNVDLLKRDQAFNNIIIREFDGKILSCVYLTGLEFNGEWMKSSLNTLCRNRKAFIGQNLFAHGACYSSVLKDRNLDKEFVYLGEFKLISNVGLYVNNMGNNEYYPLINAGESYYESEGLCEVILDDTDYIELVISHALNKNKRIVKIELENIPYRPDKTTRLRIKAKAISDSKVDVTITDLGFGEMFKSTFKEWKYTINL